MRSIEWTELKFRPQLVCLIHKNEARGHHQVQIFVGFLTHWEGISYGSKMRFIFNKMPAECIFETFVDLLEPATVFCRENGPELKLSIYQRADGLHAAEEIEHGWVKIAEM